MASLWSFTLHLLLSYYLQYMFQSLVVLQIIPGGIISLKESCHPMTLLNEDIKPYANVHAQCLESGLPVSYNLRHTSGINV